MSLTVDSGSLTDAGINYFLFSSSIVSYPEQQRRLDQKKKKKEPRIDREYRRIRETDQLEYYNQQQQQHVQKRGL